MDPFKRLSFPSFWPPRLCMIQAKELDPIELLPTNSAPRPLLSQIWEPATRGCSCVACLELPWNYKELSSQGYSTETCKAYMFLRPEEQLGKFWREEHNPFSNWILAYLALGSSSRLCLCLSHSFAILESFETRCEDPKSAAPPNHSPAWAHPQGPRHSQLELT